eukprot:CAMPEP_0201566146 /NCGR_PEP_ID=MMETSP0190_2-20130828/5713_1 /ASSEMBLY_ACC=CAM_ASM_000263 /TAXON_ID=37353 /ORGANISM="Rosalina sp." /LENGTH=585 /DNA_ID=CAMNT_0047984447 /DNA_START=99 /DNA_END=1856 /DNA_ORIENTATION=+
MAQDEETMDVDDQQPPEEENETDEQREQRALKLKAEGNKKYSAKNYREAIDLYTQAIDTFPQAAFYGNRAAALIQSYKFKEALEDCLSAVKLDPNFRKAYIRGTKCYTQLGQLDDALKFAQTGLDKFPNDKDIKQGYDRIGIIKNKLNRIEEKLTVVSKKYSSLFEGILNPKPTPSEDTPTEEGVKDDDNDEDMKDQDEKEKDYDLPKLNHRLSKEDEKEVDIAISMINSLLSNDVSQSVEMKCINIKALIIKQNYDGALSQATNVLRWNKNNSEVTKLRAIALFRNGSTDSAIKHLQQILRKDPDNKDVKVLFKTFKSIGRAKEAGNKAFKSNDLDEAIVKYTECLKLDPTNLKFNSVLYSNRAAIFLKKKKWQLAYDDATIAVDMDPAYIKAYGRRIQSLYGLERYDEAVGDAEKALRLDPSSNDLKQQLRQAKIELKKSKQKNYYKILGVEKDATEKEIKKGFRKMAMKWHPDKFASEGEEEQKKAEEKFKEIGEAYEVLKDPKMKQRYDAGVDPENLKGGMPGFGMGGGVDISHIFDLLGGMGGGGGMGGHPGFQHFSSGGHGGGHGGHGHGGQNFTFRFG